MTRLDVKWTAMAYSPDGKREFGKVSRHFSSPEQLQGIVKDIQIGDKWRLDSPLWDVGKQFCVLASDIVETFIEDPNPDPDPIPEDPPSEVVLVHVIEVYSNGSLRIDGIPWT